MCDWNDITHTLNTHPLISRWAFHPDTPETVLATTSLNGIELDLILDNTTDPGWLQLLIPLTHTSEGELWEATGWALRNTNTTGLTQHGNGIALRHSLHLPDTTPQAIHTAITHTTHTATTLHTHHTHPVT